MDTTNLNSEIKRLFFQLLATGNKYVKHVYSGSISYNVKVEDEYYCHSINFFKNANYKANEDTASDTINKLDIPTIPSNLFVRDFVCDATAKVNDNINYDNVKVSFTIDIYKLGSFPIVNLTEEEYFEAMRIISNISREFKIKQLELLDEITENAIDDLSDGI